MSPQQKTSWRADRHTPCTAVLYAVGQQCAARYTVIQSTRHSTSGGAGVVVGSSDKRARARFSLAHLIRDSHELAEVVASVSTPVACARARRAWPRAAFDPSPRSSRRHGFRFSGAPSGRASPWTHVLSLASRPFSHQHRSRPVGSRRSHLSTPAHLAGRHPAAPAALGTPRVRGRGHCTFA